MWKFLRVSDISEYKIKCVTKHTVLGKMMDMREVRDTHRWGKEVGIQVGVRNTHRWRWRIQTGGHTGEGWEPTQVEVEVRSPYPLYPISHTHILKYTQGEKKNHEKKKKNQWRVWESNPALRDARQSR